MVSVDPVDLNDSHCEFGYVVNQVALCRLALMTIVWLILILILMMMSFLLICYFYLMMCLLQSLFSDPHEPLVGS